MGSAPTARRRFQACGDTMKRRSDGAGFREVSSRTFSEGAGRRGAPARPGSSLNARSDTCLSHGVARPTLRARMEFIEVARASEIPVGRAKGVRVGARSIALYHTPKGFFASDGVCPHR